ncbi:hypothetical protein CsSME_00027068 [Camellia sinensis var. sinensis]
MIRTLIYQKNSTARNGTCEHGHKRPPHCQSLAEEIKKMHDNCHILGPDYCRHYCTFYSEAMEKEVIN